MNTEHDFFFQNMGCTYVNEYGFGVAQLIENHVWNWYFSISLKICSLRANVNLKMITGIMKAVTHLRWDATFSL